MSQATILGFPRIGIHRELKRSLEAFWRGDISREEMKTAAAGVRVRNWIMQKEAGLDVLPTNDFSLYDHVLDTAEMVGAIPQRFKSMKEADPLMRYFAMAHGRQEGGVDLAPLEMTKWFDTNYHYIVPELEEHQTFSLYAEKVLSSYREAELADYKARPVIVGPLSFLLLSKGRDRLKHAEALTAVYEELLKKLEKAGVAWVQMDEPMLAMDLEEDVLHLYRKVYGDLRKKTSIKIFLTSYFNAMSNNIDCALSLPIDALHIDLSRGMDDLAPALIKAPKDMILSMGIVDGRNIWRNDLCLSMDILDKAAEKRGADKLWVSSSCSLMHVPYDLTAETELNSEVKGWLAFAKQKMEEISVLSRGLNEGRASVADALEKSRALLVFKDRSTLIHNPVVFQKCTDNPLERAGRLTPFEDRKRIQAEKLKLPLYPTTTIGSFPHTDDIRQNRADYLSRKHGLSTYESFLKGKIQECIKAQDELGLDVLVHGEFERNDMVEYFAEFLTGFTVTQQGWVQSFGTRYVRPPIIFGDVERKKPMTVFWSMYAQSLTQKPVKGMLTGPVTIMQWSFVRDDQPRRDTAHQIALALRDEVLDLERAGLKIIQIDEPAFREGLPLRKREWRAYFDWAVRAFCLSYTGVKDETQIHTHMCYSDFNAIIGAIRELDADVISIEACRSRMEILDAFETFRYPNDIGLGIYDIHSKRVPSEEEMEELLKIALKLIPHEQLWVNPDCGLRTRGWQEVKASLANMVVAAQKMREKAVEKGF